ncbi:hypothetical protein [Bacillus pseudomycoides]|uniref:hypothetical protein n=1 Tax=Bacillus pseudomycoides TaxID=64104 RepID=UPI0020D26E5B|nr:hypothetical protein [Bacillus pseudomycoides]
MSNKIVKSVAFSKLDKSEMQFLEHTKKHNHFSTYVKRLIQRDMENGVKVDFKVEDAEKIKRLEARIVELENALTKMSKIIDEVK